LSFNNKPFLIFGLKTGTYHRVSLFMFFSCAVSTKFHETSRRYETVKKEENVQTDDAANTSV